MSRTGIAWRAGDAMLCKRIADALETARADADPMQTNRRRTLYRLELPPSSESDPTPEYTSDASTSKTSNPPSGAPLELVAKLHHRRTGLRGLREDLKRLLRHSPARREWDALRTIADLGLPGPRAIAWGRTAEGEEILVTTFVEGRLLREALAERTPGEVSEAARDLAQSVRRLHAAGHRHGDLHLGNLLYSDRRIFLLDPGRMRRLRRRSQSLADWARLDSSIARAVSGVASRASATHLEAFHLALRSERGPLSELAAARIRFDRDYQRGRARRLLRRGRRWKAVRMAPGVSGLAEVGVDERALRAGYAAVESEAGGSGSLRRSGRARIVESMLGETRIVLKRVEAGGIARALADRFRGSVGSRAFRRGQAALLLNHPCARPIAFVERRRMGFPVTSWLWMEKVGEADLDEYLAADPTRATRIARPLGDWLAGLHAAGFRHRDLKASNLRVTAAPHDFPNDPSHESSRNALNDPLKDPSHDALKDGPEAGPDGVRFCLVDLEDLCDLARPSERERIEALAQLNASLAEEHMSTAARLSALEAYAARLPLDRPLEAIARDVAECSRARQHRWKGNDCLPTTPR